MKKTKEIIKLDIDISFEDAMKHLASTPASKVDDNMKKEKPKKALTKTNDKKLLKAPKTQKLLPKYKSK